MYFLSVSPELRYRRFCRAERRRSSSSCTNHPMPSTKSNWLLATCSARASIVSTMPESLRLFSAPVSSVNDIAIGVFLRVAPGIPLPELLIDARGADLRPVLLELNRHCAARNGGLLQVSLDKFVGRAASVHRNAADALNVL